MLHRKLEPIDHANLYEYYKSIENSIKWSEYGHKGKQSGIQYKPGEDPFIGAVGKGRYPDVESTELNQFYQGTIIEEIVNKFSLTRTRWMWVGPYACYSIHQDSSSRIHIPLVTNKDCYFLFPHVDFFHFEPGHVYWADTTLPHTFINCSDQHRLHLVGSVDRLKFINS
jgi:hypothetical protein